MRYETLIDKLNNQHHHVTFSERREAVDAITKLVATLREYNPDDEFFADEKKILSVS